MSPGVSVPLGRSHSITSSTYGFPSTIGFARGSTTQAMKASGSASRRARETGVVAGMLALVWVGSVRVPSSIARVAGVLASASLYIYLAHWQVYPHLEDRFPLAATVLALGAGIAFWMVASRVMPHVERWLLSPRRVTRVNARRGR